MISRERAAAVVVHVLHLLTGLMRIHERGIAHRDIKPSNLMVYMPPNQGTSIGTGSEKEGTMGRRDACMEGDRSTARVLTRSKGDGDEGGRRVHDSEPHGLVLPRKGDAVTNSEGVTAKFLDLGNAKNALSRQRLGNQRRKVRQGEAEGEEEVAEVEQVEWAKPEGALVPTETDLHARCYQSLFSSVEFEGARMCRKAITGRQEVQDAEARGEWEGGRGRAGHVGGVLTRVVFGRRKDMHENRFLDRSIRQLQVCVCMCVKVSKPVHGVL